MSRAAHLALVVSIVAVVVRFIGINQPYDDNWSWRQSDVAAIARNFYSKGFDFTRPQIDWAGDQPGYVGTEFPILPFFAALTYKVFGVQEWIGRSQAAILFALSLPFFFLLARRTLGEFAAGWALFFYAFAPLSIFTGREFMPDVPSLSLALIGLYFFLRWIETEKSMDLLVAAVATCLSLLIKLPSAVVGAPLACLAWQKWRWNMFRQWALWVFAAAALIPSAIWYWHAYEIALKFYPHHFFGAGGIRLMNPGWYLRIAREIANSSLTMPFLAVSVIGAFVGRTSLRAHLFYWWLAAMLLFTVVAGYGNRHQWYQLPFVPIAAALAGLACEYFDRKISSRSIKTGLAILLVTAFGFSAWKAVRPIYHSRASLALHDLGLALKDVAPPGSLIVAADNGDPTVFYYAERTGWHFLEQDGIVIGDPLNGDEAIADLNKLRARGATHLVFIWATVWWLDYYKEFAQHINGNATLISETPEFKIYRLNTLTK